MGNPVGNEGLHSFPSEEHPASPLPGGRAEYHLRFQLPSEISNLAGVEQPHSGASGPLAFSLRLPFTSQAVPPDSAPFTQTLKMRGPAYDFETSVFPLHFSHSDASLPPLSFSITVQFPRSRIPTSFRKIQRVHSV